MSLILKISSGGVCAAAVVVLGFAFWPHVRPDKISAKSQVAQPEFVVASASTKTLAAPAGAAAAELTLDKAAQGKLAAAAGAKPALSLAAGPRFGQSGAEQACHGCPGGPRRRGGAEDPRDRFPRQRRSAVGRCSAARDAGRRQELRSGPCRARHRRHRRRTPWLERAADLGDARALLALGDAYNPAMLARFGVLYAPGDLSPSQGILQSGAEFRSRRGARTPRLAYDYSGLTGCSALPRHRNSRRRSLSLSFARPKNSTAPRKSRR